MDSIGEVVAILNSEYVLVNMHERASPGDVLEVVHVQALDQRAQEATALTELRVPVGRITIASHQKESVYLASTQANEDVERTIVRTPPIFSMGILGEQVRESVPKTRRAPVNKEQALGVGVPQAISVGDIVVKVY